MKRILEYLKEEMFIEPVANTTVDVIEEYADTDCPCVGRRLVLNGKETDIVVWFADYDSWLEKKLENAEFEINRAKDCRCIQDLMTDKEKQQYNEFCEKHRKCEFSSTIGGKISVEVTGTGLGYCFKCKCASCGKEEHIADVDSW